MYQAKSYPTVHLFLSTPSARRATASMSFWTCVDVISIHALREEGDNIILIYIVYAVYFYPRPPRGGRPNADLQTMKSRLISIHALREEGDQLADVRGVDARIFLSTPSARRATSTRILRPPPAPDFYPRPPRGGRLFSCHCRTAFLNFYPRPPRGGRLPLLRCQTQPAYISIHALREEGDDGLLCWVQLVPDFYPRPPRGGRQQKQRQNLYFQTNYTTFCTNLEEP